MVVFFDIGSTLIEGPVESPGRQLAKQVGLPEAYTEDINAFLLTTPMEDADTLARFVTERFGVDCHEASIAASLLWSAQQTEARAIPGARDAIERLNRAGIRHGFISNIWLPYYRAFRQLFSEHSESAPAIVSFEVGLRKPSEEIYRRALERFGVAARESVMVGDSYDNDIEPAMSHGMKTIWVLHRLAKEKSDLLRVLNGQAAAPDLTLGSIGELNPRLVQSMLTD